MALALESVVFPSPDPARSAQFWGAMTDRPWFADSHGAAVAGTPTQAGLRFEPGALYSDDDERMHLHLSQTARNQREWIDACIAAGATMLGSGNIPANSYARMADVVGQKYCIIEDDNSYLEGCGPLGEVTCTGTRAVAGFWRGALGWPVVWDQNDELAIQSALGGTKLAWDGVSPTPGQVRSGQRFVLRADRDEIGRLQSLGAGLLAVDDEGTATLTDPDGVTFTVIRPN